MSGSLGELVISLSADMAKFRNDMGQAQKVTNDTMQKISSDMDRGIAAVQGSFKMLASVAAGATAFLAGGAMFKDMVNTTNAVAGEVGKLSRQLGITAQQASVLRIALDDAFLSVEDMQAGANRITKQLLSNEDAFKRLGVATRDSNGHYRNTVDIMMEVNSALSKIKAGTDQNVAGMSIYGKSWGEVRGLMKLTKEAMDEAAERAKELHLLIGPEQVAASRQYKLAMKDLEDVNESLKVQIGKELIPVLTDLSVAFGKAGTSAAGFFAETLHDGVTKMGAFKSWLGRQADRIPQDKELFNWSEYQARQNSEEQLYLYNMGKWAEKRGGLTTSINRAIAPVTPPKGDSIDPDKFKTKAAHDDTQQWVSAHEKYLSYLKAFAARQQEEVKQAAALEQEVNRQSYEWGLTDLQSYLAKKHALTEKEISDEIALAQKEQSKYATEVAKWKDDKTAKGANAYHDALLKQEDATKRLSELQGKLNMARVQGEEEDKRGFYEQMKGLSDLSVQLLEAEGHYRAAAEAKDSFYRSSPEYFKLSPLEREKKDSLLDREGMLAAQREASELSNIKLNTQGIRAATPDLFGNMSGGRSIEYERRKKELDDLVALEVNKEVTDLERYSAYLEQRAALDEQYAAEQAAVRSSFDRQMMDQQLNAADQSLQLMRQAAGDNKAVAIMVMAMEKAIAIERILQNAAVARSAALASSMMFGPAAPGVMAGLEAEIDAMTAVNIGIVAASAVIDGMQIAGKRATGGTVRAGETYLVGEKGPELMTAAADGYVTPNHMLGGSIQITNYNDFRNADPGTEARLRAEMRASEQRTKSDILDSMRRGGQYSTAPRRG